MSAAQPPAAAAVAPAAAPAAAVPTVKVTSPAAVAAATAAAAPTVTVTSAVAPVAQLNQTEPESVWRSPLEPFLLAVVTQTLLHNGDQLMERVMAMKNGKPALPRGKLSFTTMVKRNAKVLRPSLPPFKVVAPVSFYFTTYECFREDVLSGPGFFSRFGAGFIAGTLGFGMTTLLPEHCDRARWNMTAPRVEASAAADLAKQKAQLLDLGKLSKKARAVAMAKLDAKAAAAASTFAHAAPTVTSFPIYAAMYNGLHRALYFGIYGKLTGEMSVRHVAIAPAHKFQAEPAVAAGAPVSALDAALAAPEENAAAAPTVGSIVWGGVRLVGKCGAAAVASVSSGLVLHANESIRLRTLASQSLPSDQRFTSTLHAAKHLLKNDVFSLFEGVQTLKWRVGAVQGALMLLAFDYAKTYYVNSKWSKFA